MHLLKESLTKNYSETTRGCLIEEIKQYFYETEDEKKSHMKEMLSEGFTDTGQVKENVGTVMKPIHRWFGSYYRYNRITTES